MTEYDIFERLEEIAKHYDIDGWPLYDLQCDLEEVFEAVLKRRELIDKYDSPPLRPLICIKCGNSFYADVMCARGGYCTNNPEISTKS